MPRNLNPGQFPDFAPDANDFAEMPSPMKEGHVPSPSDKYYSLSFHGGVGAHDPANPIQDYGTVANQDGIKVGTTGKSALGEWTNDRFK
jgi:hypothetical protein